MDFAPKNKSSN